MAYVQFSTLCMPVLHVHQCLTNFGFLIYNQKQARYQPITKITNWPVLGSFNNWNIILLSHKSTPFEAFDEIHKVVIGGISENMASIFQPGMYGAINNRSPK